MAIVQAERVGVWNVPFIYGAYLIKGDLITHKDEEKRPNFIHKLLDADMSFCANLREADVFFYVTNRANFGHLGTIHILRKHFYSTKLNFTSKFFTKTGFLFFKTKEFLFQHYILTKFSCCSLNFFLVDKEKCSKNS